MDTVLTQAYRVRSYHINADRRLSPPSLLNFLQETAGLHATALHFGMGDLHEKNHTWVLSRVYLEMDRWPVLQQTITVETWPRGIDRLFATRDFLIMDQDMNPIGRASSYWLIVDKTSRRPQSPRHISEHVLQEERKAVDRRLEKIQSPDQVSSEEFRKAYYTDTDMNGHVNNVRYAEWILDSIPMDIHSHLTVKSIEINYLAEVMPGQLVVIQLGPLADKTIHAAIKLKESQKEACRSIITYNS